MCVCNVPLQIIQLNKPIATKKLNLIHNILSISQSLNVMMKLKLKFEIKSLYLPDLFSHKFRFWTNTKQLPFEELVDTYIHTYINQL